MDEHTSDPSVTPPAGNPTAWGSESARPDGCFECVVPTSRRHGNGSGRPSLDV